MILFQRNSNYGYHLYCCDKHQTKPLSEWNSDIEQNYCFYYSIYETVPFVDFLDPPHIDFLRKNSAVKVVYDSSGEAVHADMVEELVHAARTWRLKNKQIVFVLIDTLQQRFVKKELKKQRARHLIHLTLYNPYLDYSHDSMESTQVQRKFFSLLCRRHRPWRSYLMSELVNRSLLDRFHFSYHGVDNHRELTTSSIIQDVEQTCGVSTTEQFERFVDTRPHRLDDQAEVFTYPQSYIDASDFHIVVEHAWFDELDPPCEEKIETVPELVAVFDPKTKIVYGIGPDICFPSAKHTVSITEDFYEQVINGVIPINACHRYIPDCSKNFLHLQFIKLYRNFIHYLKSSMHYCKQAIKSIKHRNYLWHQSHFISEKTYKAIAAKKPFLVLSDPGFLKALTSLGFKTFGPYINEDYDQQTDHKKRISMIVEEIEKISNLDQARYDQLIMNCQRIADKNYQTLINLKKSNGFEI